MPLDNSIIGRLSRNAVKQRLFRRFVRRASPAIVNPLAAKRMADIYFCITYGGMTRTRASELFGVSRERVGQILRKGANLKEQNKIQVCHPSGSCLIGSTHSIKG